MVYVRTRDHHAYLFTKLLDIQNSHKDAKTVLNVV